VRGEERPRPAEAPGTDSPVGQTADSPVGQIADGDGPDSDTPHDGPGGRPPDGQAPEDLIGRAPEDPIGRAPEDLIGRAAETAAIRQLLDGRRLVTVTGLPGVGKTALSVAAAAAAAGNFADGALVVRLDTLRDEVLLPHTIMAALQVPDRFTRSPLEVLTSELRDRHLLLVLDTCEHLLGACAGLAMALLTPCPKVQILATSREPLRVPGEAELAIRPLLLRDALALFVRRAEQAGVAVAPENRATASSICVQLDKLPLAIELAAGQLARNEAAGRTAAGRLADLLRHLEADYDFPRDPDQPAARHQTLRAAIGWSHELCTPAERLLWARLSVFAGSFRLSDAQDVCTTSQLPDEVVTAGLSLLTERSVLLADKRAPGEYFLPVILRGYGRQMLRRLGEDAEFAERYRRWQDTRRRGRGYRVAN
jgi:predicted ATPase